MRWPARSPVYCQEGEYCYTFQIPVPEAEGWYPGGADIKKQGATKKFSTYAVGYDKPASDGGGDGGSARSHTMTTTAGVGGSITPKNPQVYNGNVASSQNIYRKAGMSVEQFQTGCLLCGAELVYLPQAEAMVCAHCGKTFTSNACCANGHYICDDCHGAPVSVAITQACLASREQDPLALAEQLMALPGVKMHGPEHHYLVPAALLTAAANCGWQLDLPGALQEAKKRSHNVLGGFCGLYGACGAGIGVGMFVSILTGATPLSQEEWGLANLATAAALTAIGQQCGPRCCKRDTRLAIATAASFAKEKLGVPLPVSSLTACQYDGQNKQCKRADCPYYQA